MPCQFAEDGGRVIQMMMELKHKTKKFITATGNSSLDLMIRKEITCKDLRHKKQLKTLYASCH